MKEKISINVLKEIKSGLNNKRSLSYIQSQIHGKHSKTMNFNDLEALAVIVDNLPPIEQWGVHINHCCKEHGCKYGYENCPVDLMLIEQKYPCIDCKVDYI